MRPVGNYPTKPFDCWNKMKDLRMDLYRRISLAKEQGKLLVSGSAGSPTEILAGFGEFEFIGGEPYGATVGNFQDLAQECYDAYEARGFTRDHCAYLRAYIGGVFLNRSPWGEFPKPHFVMTRHSCDSHGKWYQIMAEHWDLPYYVLENLRVQPGMDKAHCLAYYEAQFHDLIDWVEKVSGRKFDDEKFIVAVDTSCRIRDLWTEICILNQNIPAPMDQKSQYTFYNPAVHMRTKKEALELYRILYAEMKDRVANGIAALSTERCRIQHENIPPWFALHILRFIEKYGAVGIGSTYTLGFGGFQELPDGTWGRYPSMEERGVVLRTREDAVRELSERYLRGGEERDCAGKANGVVFVARSWHADGVMWHLNRGCEGQSLGDLEARLIVQKELDLPTMVYEGNQGDRREWNEAQALDRIQAFLEGTLGLERLVS